MKHYANNDRLLDVLKEHGIKLPDNYFWMNGKNHKKAQETLQLQRASGIAPPITNRYYIPLKLWIYKNTAGAQAMNPADLPELIRKTNNIFRASDVPIVVYMKCDISYIVGDVFYHINTSNEANSMFAAFNDPNALNVHFVNTGYANGTNFAGLAKRPGTSQALARSGQNEITFANELGHNFGLVHTHEGRWPCGGANASCNDCTQEPVSRTRRQARLCWGGNASFKCEVNGDGLCDTPADPKLVAGTNYIYDGNLQEYFYTGTGTDNWGEAWQPDKTNLMSYGAIERTHFKYGQSAVMLDNMPSFATTSPGYGISGQYNLCHNQSYAFSIPSLPGNSSYTWQVPNIVTNLGFNTWPLTGQGGTTMTTTSLFYINEAEVAVMPECNYPMIYKPVNPIQVHSIEGPSEMPADDVVYQLFMTDDIPNATYTWSVPSGWSVLNGQGRRTALITAGFNGVSGNVQVSSNACGGLNGFKWVNVTTGGGGGQQMLSIYPNPAVHQLTLSPKHQTELDITIYKEATGEIVLSTRLIKQKTIDVSQLARGNYIIEATSKKDKIVKQLIIKE
jgi:hypothetical protein